MTDQISTIKDFLAAKKRGVSARSKLGLRKLRNYTAINHLSEHFNLVPGQTPEVFSEFRAKIDALGAYVDRDYCILDMPSHGNIGDHLIYEGNLAFLNTLPYQKKYEASLYTFEKSKIGPDDLIILHGGGNMGDLYPPHQKFREKVISSFKNNKIIVLPQTIFFQNDKDLKEAVSIFTAHPNLTLCVRDNRSLETAKKHFSANNILLLPDMASYMQPDYVKGRKKSDGSKTVFIKRKDKELQNIFDPTYINNLEIRDWPTYDFEYFNILSSKHKKHRFYMNEGLIFMAQYDLVITTRLHGCIMALLLDIPVIMVDNNYEKNLTYYETWLKDTPDCYFAYSPDDLKILIQKHFPRLL